MLSSPSQCFTMDRALADVDIMFALVVLQNLFLLVLSLYCNCFTADNKHIETLQADKYGKLRFMYINVRTAYEIEIWLIDNQIVFVLFWLCYKRPLANVLI